jgi:nucleotide-binding universal stress UspA family protein
MKKLVTRLLLLVGILGVLSSRILAAVPDAQSIPAGVALELMFDEHRTAKPTSRALLQRKTFLDMLEVSKERLQIAFVIDGTDSMGTDIQSVLDSLEPMVESLRRHKDGAENVSFSAVVYRDSEAPSGPVCCPLGRQFTDDVQTLRDGLSEIETETGRPYFPELVDLGIMEAIQGLAWEEAADTSRWILVFGDAPPYKEGYRNEQQNAQRHYSTEDLVTSAAAKEIVVSFVLCHSGFTKQLNVNDRLIRTYEAALPRTQAFMQEVSTVTGGVLWDLTEPDLREDLAEAVTRTPVRYQRIEEITPDEVIEVRAEAARDDLDVRPDARLRIAVLPHLPLEEMSFDSEHPAVQVGAELRERLRKIPRVEVVNAHLVAATMTELRRSGSPSDQWIPRLARDLEVDYVLWGSYGQSNDAVQLESVFYQRVDGRGQTEAVRLADATETMRSGDSSGEASLVPVVANRLLRNTAAELRRSGADENTVSVFSRVDEDEELADELAAPVSSNVRARRELLAGMDLLEQAMAFPTGSLKAAELLERAVLKLGAAAMLDAKNPLIHAMLSNCHYNLARTDRTEGHQEKSLESLKRAYELRNNASSDAVRLEVEADYALLVERDVAEAISIYEMMLLEPDRPLQLRRALRAHWMLAGIYYGDWSVPSSFVDPSKAREHIIQVLAHWSESPEARFYKDAFEWDENEGMQKHYVPLENSDTLHLASDR